MALPNQRMKLTRWRSRSFLNQKTLDLNSCRAEDLLTVVPINSKIALLRGVSGELVAPFVFEMSGVTGHAQEPSLMAGARGDQLLPQIAILHRLLVAVLPSVLRPPLREPSDHLANQIGGVGVQGHVALRLQCPQARDGRHQRGRELVRT